MKSLYLKKIICIYTLRCFNFIEFLCYFLGCFFYINVHEVNRRRFFVVYYQLLYLLGTKRQEISSAASNLRYFSNYIQLVTVL